MVFVYRVLFNLIRQMAPIVDADVKSLTRIAGSRWALPSS